ncbi:MAG: ABC transporter permease [Chloroflexi bacterium]|nr:ABC transporter permease [Chloroflexota bacterium]
MAAASTGEGELLDVRLAGVAPWRRWYAQHERLTLGVLGFVSVLAFWELTVQVGWMKRVFLSSPTAIYTAFLNEARAGTLWTNISVSLLEFLLGFFIAAVVGVTIGLIGGWFRRANYILDPWLSALYATPDIALVPLIILVLGIDLQAKVFVVFLTSLFSVAVNTLIGVQSIDIRMLEVARSFGASHLRVFRTVILPGTVPFMLSGLRLASGRALVGVVLAELLAANAGLGFMINLAGSTLNTARMMVGVLLLGFFGVLLGEGLRRVEQHFEVWRPKRQD